jgi:hypothetical protein
MGTYYATPFLQSAEELDLKYESLKFLQENCSTVEIVTSSMLQSKQKILPEQVFIPAAVGFHSRYVNSV